MDQVQLHIHPLQIKQPSLKRWRQYNIINLLTNNIADMKECLSTIEELHDFCSRVNDLMIFVVSVAK